MNYTRISKLMSLLLRHQPEKAHLDIDVNGWVNVDQLVRNMNVYCGTSISREDIYQIVQTDAKQRYALSANAEKIRANQGHSIQVDLGLKERDPPSVLFHGTGKKSVQSILEEGLKKMSRQHVHLSQSIEVATSVGKRHGSVCIFKIRSKEMAENGYKFYLSENNVWLTDSVPAEFLELL